ncbi:TPA: flagellar protein MotY [Photobacterium damselae]
MAWHQKQLTIISRCLLCYGLFLPLPSFAVTQYLAKPSQSQWQLKTNTQLECQLVHQIPGYGLAQFVSKAGKKINLDFEIDLFRSTGKTANVNLVSMPARWMPGDAAQRMLKLKFFKQFNGYVGGKTAWTMLSELERGRNPTFSYRDWYHSNRYIDVGLSAVAFQKPYQEFNQCLNQLLPYSFDDISFTILHYDNDSEELNELSRKRLMQIADFVRAAKDVDLVLVATYTDSFGTKNENQDLSERRANKLHEYFISLGLPPDRIKVQAFGERREIADNNTPIGRNLNRRVVISLGRSL